MDSRNNPYPSPLFPPEDETAVDRPVTRPQQSLVLIPLTHPKHTVLTSAEWRNALTAINALPQCTYVVYDKGARCPDRAVLLVGWHDVAPDNCTELLVQSLAKVGSERPKVLTTACRQAVRMAGSCQGRALRTRS